MMVFPASILTTEIKILHIESQARSDMNVFTSMWLDTCKAQRKKHNHQQRLLVLNSETLKCHVASYQPFISLFQFSALVPFHNRCSLHEVTSRSSLVNYSFSRQIWKRKFEISEINISRFSCRVSAVCWKWKSTSDFISPFGRTFLLNGVRLWVGSRWKEVNCQRAVSRWIRKCVWVYF